MRTSISQLSARVPDASTHSLALAVSGGPSWTSAEACKKTAGLPAARCPRRSRLWQGKYLRQSVRCNVLQKVGRRRPSAPLATHHQRFGRPRRETAQGDRPLLPRRRCTYQLHHQCQRAVANMILALGWGTPIHISAPFFTMHLC